MDIRRWRHYCQRVRELGVRRTTQVVEQRVRTAFFERMERRRAALGQAHHRWPQVAHGLGVAPDFPRFFPQLADNELPAMRQALALNLSAEQLMAQADAAVAQTFDLLGSGLHTFQTIPWHEDFRLKMQNPGADVRFNPTTFYRDVRIMSGADYELVKDIKVPWELSRFQHLVILGQAYEQTGKICYANAFFNQVADWLDANPYLLGANWVCPMDVGIRAANWIVGFQFFKGARPASDPFWQRFVCSLYDHLVYLENNWEVYDSITSNHYLSDLIGYLYLGAFFRPATAVQDKIVWCHRELIKEFEKQVFDEGTDYEGSTSYHGLVTEIFYHWYALSQDLGLAWSTERYQKLGRMFDFREWCTPPGGALVTIGDDDSGKVVAGLPEQTGTLVVDRDQQELQGIKHFPAFGLSVLRTADWHVTLRHHAYQKVQPSGHFHNDVGSMTLAYQGRAIITDPGSYVYTPSAAWRNALRSAAAHSCVSLVHQEPVAFTQSLFNLALPPGQCGADCSSDDQLVTTNSLYEQIGVVIHRSIDFQDEVVEVCDVLRVQANAQEVEAVVTFVFDADVTVRKSANEWLVGWAGRDVVRITCDVDLAVEQTWIAQGYGARKTSKKLIGRLFSRSETVCVTKFQRLVYIVG